MYLLIKFEGDSVKVVQTKDTMSDIYLDALRIRNQVFMVEQEVPAAIEIDQHEALCIHFVLYKNDVPIATCRLLPQENGVMKLQRMAVKKEFRGHNYGLTVIEAAEQFARSQGYNRVILGAQMTAVGFYERQGYETYGERFWDADMEHLMMQKDLGGADKRPTC